MFSFVSIGTSAGAAAASIVAPDVWHWPAMPAAAHQPSEPQT
jgi:hypothetical protein